MATSKAKKRKTSSKLTDAQRHARFVDTARKIEASEDPKDFEKAFSRVVGKAATRKS